MKIDTRMLKEFGGRLAVMIALGAALAISGAALGLSAGCGGSSGGGGSGEYTPVDVTMQAAFDTKGADPRGMRFVFDRDMAPSISKAAEEKALDPADFIDVLDAGGNLLATTHRWIDARTLMVFAEVTYCNSYDVVFRAGFPVDLSSVMAADQEFSVTFRANPNDVNGDCAADPIFANPNYNCFSDGSCKGIQGNALVFSGANLGGGLVSDPLDLQFRDSLTGETVMSEEGTNLLMWASQEKFGVKDTMGFQAVNVGDVDDDGYPEFAIPYSGADMKGLMLAGVKDAGVYDDKMVLDGLNAEARRVGDVTGDGIDDLLLVGKEGAYVFAGGKELKGTIPVPVAMTMVFAALQLPAELEPWGGNFLTTVEGVGDVTGDGVNDIAAAFIGVDTDARPPAVVGAYLAIYAGSGEERAAAKGMAVPTTELSFAKVLIELPEDEIRLFGFSMAGGDIDGDTVGELLVGAPAITTSSGRAYLYGYRDIVACVEEGEETAAPCSPSPQAIFELSSADGTSGASSSAAKSNQAAELMPFSSAGPGRSFGTSVAMADVISAGPREILIGSPMENKVYVFMDETVLGEEGLAGSIDEGDAASVVSLSGGPAFQDAYYVIPSDADVGMRELAMMGYAMQVEGEIHADAFEDVSFFGAHAKTAQVQTYEPVCTWKVGEVSEDLETCRSIPLHGVSFGTLDSGPSAQYCDQRDADNRYYLEYVLEGQQGLIVCTAPRASWFKNSAPEGERVTLSNCCREQMREAGKVKQLSLAQNGFAAVLFGGGNLDEGGDLVSKDFGTILRNATPAKTLRDAMGNLIQWWEISRISPEAK